MPPGAAGAAPDVAAGCFGCVAGSGDGHGALAATAAGALLQVLLGGAMGPGVMPSGVNGEYICAPTCGRNGLPRKNIISK